MMPTTTMVRFGILILGDRGFGDWCLRRRFGPTVGGKKTGNKGCLMLLIDISDGHRGSTAERGIMLMLILMRMWV